MKCRILRLTSAQCPSSRQELNGANAPYCIHLIPFMTGKDIFSAASGFTKRETFGQIPSIYEVFGNNKVCNREGRCTSTPSLAMQRCNADHYSAIEKRSNDKALAEGSRRRPNPPWKQEKNNNKKRSLRGATKSTGTHRHEVVS